MSLAPVANAELHLHLEGSLSAESAVEIASLRGHPWGALTPARLHRRFRYGSFTDFLRTIREMCVVLSSYEALERTARELSLQLARDGIHYAEVYCSPYIFVRWGMDYSDTLRAIDRGFALGQESGGAHCAILLDTVRQWGPEAAANVLDGYEECRIERVVGFGMGGEEGFPLEDFAPAYDRARRLGLHTTVHAGEVNGPDDIRKAIDILGVDRVAHGIHAVDDAKLLAPLRDRRIVLDVAIISNYRTRIVKGPHPVRTLLDAGVIVTLGTDDPSLFRTTLPKEFAVARRCCSVTESELRQLARNAIDGSFAGTTRKAALMDDLDRRFSA